MMTREEIFKVYEDGKFIGFELIVDGNWASVLAPDFVIRSEIISSFNAKNIIRSRNTGIKRKGDHHIYDGDVFQDNRLFSGKSFKVVFTTHVAMIVFKDGTMKYLFEVESYLKNLSPIGNVYSNDCLVKF